MQNAFTVKIDPLGKPRMTQRDKRRGTQTQGVRRYVAWQREFVNALRLQDFYQIVNLHNMVRIDIRAMHQMPVGWGLKRKREMAARIMRQSPDADNVAKAIIDSIFYRQSANDKVIAIQTIEQRWEDSRGPRIDLIITQSEEEALSPTGYNPEIMRAKIMDHIFVAPCTQSWKDFITRQTKTNNKEKT